MTRHHSRQRYNMLNPRPSLTPFCQSRSAIRSTANSSGTSLFQSQQSSAPLSFARSTSYLDQAFHFLVWLLAGEKNMIRSTFSAGALVAFGT
jgi:hypothetical protein